MTNHICGFYYCIPAINHWQPPQRRYLPQVSLSAHTTIISSTSRTLLTQTFTNPDKDKPIPELRYTFPLYDGVSVVGFVCTINKDRVIRGVVQERAQAKKTYQAAVDRGETAGLLEQLPDASDVFTTTVGNVPAGAELKVEITYLGELKHDAEVDGIRFTIPTSIAPRYGNYPGELLQSNFSTKGSIEITVDAEMPTGSSIKSVQSPSHPISVSIGNTSVSAAANAEPSLQKASATLSLGTAELDKDFILHVVATNTSNPIAVLETHPTIEGHRALMATLVPRFNLPPIKPEIVFVCDRSGSMSGSNIINLRSAMQVFLKSLPVGVKFNICSFGSRYEFLFKKSETYDESSLKKATAYVDKIDANFGGTEMMAPLEETLKKRYKDMQLEVFLITDGEIWNQNAMFDIVNRYVEESKGQIRIFTLAIGTQASHALVEGVARAGNGFCQAVGNNEKMNSKVVRMLKAALTPHVTDYTLEVKYGKDATPAASTPVQDAPPSYTADDDFEIIEKVMDALTIEVSDPDKAKTTSGKAPAEKPTISLFDPAADPDVEMKDATLDDSAEGKYSHVPAVSEPKLLQAPFNIPPLFPFNRTSVYLLLSPGSVQRMPTSVILRGTSSHGPLALQIPVTVLAEPGATIHQLAARKAVKELEEGRGWLYHAKEGEKLLKEKYQGRFNDMVEREAVRLGVKFQVGGKWCSFVAVDDKEKDKKKEQEQQQSEGVVHPEPLAMAAAGFDRMYGRAAPAPPVTRMRAAAPSSFKSGTVANAPSNQQPLDYKMECQMDFANPGLSSDVLDGFDFDSFLAEAAPVASAVDTRRSAPMFSGAFGSASGFASAAPPPPAPTGSPYSLGGVAGMPAPSSYGALHSMSGAPSMPAMAQMQQAVPQRQQMQQSQPALQDYQQQLMLLEQGGKVRYMMARAEQDGPEPKRTARGMAAPGSGSRGRLRKAARSASESVDDDDEDEMTLPGGASGQDTLEQLVFLQAFTGAWAWNKAVLAVLGLSVSMDTKFSVAYAKDDKLATAMVLAFLEVKLRARREEWEMLAEKAKMWLAGEVGGEEKATAMVEDVKGLF